MKGVVCGLAEGRDDFGVEFGNFRVISFSGVNIIIDVIGVTLLLIFSPVCG